MVLQNLLRIKYFQLNVFLSKVLLYGFCVEITLQKEHTAVSKDVGAERAWTKVD